MVRQPERDRVYILSRQQLVKIAVCLTVFVFVVVVHDIDSVLQMTLIYVADGNDLTIVLANERVEVARPLPADTYAAHSNAITRCDIPILAQSRRGNDIRKTYCADSSTGCCLEKLPPTNVSIPHHFFILPFQ